MDQLNSTVVTSNFSSPGHPPHASWDSSFIAGAVVFSLCFLLGVPGNMAVIIRRPNMDQLSNLSKTLMLNLAMSDLLCLLTMPLWIYSYLYSWIFSLVACKIVTYFVYCNVYSSLLTVTVLSIQRYLQVVNMQTSPLQIRRKWLLVLLWLSVMILSIPALVHRKLVKVEHWTKCRFQYASPGPRMAVLLEESLLGFASFIVVAFTYISLYRKVHQTAFFNNPKTTRLVTSIIMTFVVLWMPYLVTNMLGVAALALKHDGLLNFCMSSWRVTRSLVFLNSSLNPLLYACASIDVCAVCQNKPNTNTVVNAEAPTSTTSDNVT